jgi:hypothetical protein
MLLPETEPVALNGPCTWCGFPGAPMVLPAAQRYTAPAVYACPVADMTACDARKRAVDAAKALPRKALPSGRQARKTLLGRR